MARGESQLLSRARRLSLVLTRAALEGNKTRERRKCEHVGLLEGVCDSTVHRRLLEPRAERKRIAFFVSTGVIDRVWTHFCVGAKKRGAVEMRCSCWVEASSTHFVTFFTNLRYFYKTLFAEPSEADCTWDGVGSDSARGGAGDRGHVPVSPRQALRLFYSFIENNTPGGTTTFAPRMLYPISCKTRRNGHGIQQSKIANNTTRSHFLPKLLQRNGVQAQRNTLPFSPYFSTAIAK